MIDADMVVRAVAHGYHLTVEEIKSSTKRRYITSARQVAYYLLWRTGLMSKSEIARYFGRTFSAVSYGITTVINLMEVDRRFNHQVLYINGTFWHEARNHT